MEIFGQLPIDIIKIIIEFRAYQSIIDKLQKWNVNIDIFFKLLKEHNGFIFGSFVLACLLDSNDYNDIDIIHPPWKNQIIGSIIGSFGLKESDSKYTPRSICKNCGKICGDSELFKYKRSHLFENGLKMDFVESNNVMEHIGKNSFDIDKIYFDGYKFHFVGDLLKFVSFPSFHIIDLKKGIDFQFIYDPWSMNCETTNKRKKHWDESEEILDMEEGEEISFDKPTHLNEDYESDTLTYSAFDSLQLNRDQLKTIIKNKFYFSWFKKKHLDLEVNLITELILKHYKQKGKYLEIGKYRLTRSFFRIIKLKSRGFICSNQNLFFDP